MNHAIKDYLANLDKERGSGVATENTYRPALKALLESLLPGRDVINEPSHIGYDAPDFLVRSHDAAHRPVGYVETKDIGDSDLEGYAANKEQFDRYKARFHNIFFTDYLDFRFWEDGTFKESVRIASLEGGRFIPADEETLERFVARIKHFGEVRPRMITSPARLATLMAHKARLLAAAIRGALAADTEKRSQLACQMVAFREKLLQDIDEGKFADLYAQTMAYSFFAARFHDDTLENFSRMEAVRRIPKSNPFLRRLFLDLESDLDDSIAWIVDDLVALFAAADVRKIMQDYNNDPVLHFYEDFLAAYDPDLRKRRGVWYTPASVVKFIVGAVDELLIQTFGLPGGLADCSKTEVSVANVSPETNQSLPFVKREMHRVQILDPATGTGTFLAETVKKIYSKFASMKGAWSDYAAKNLLPRLNGFEVLMASYAMAHLKLDMLLQETLEGCSPPGTDGNSFDRFRVFLANSLAEPVSESGTTWSFALAQEVQEANRIKRDCPVMVVMGNPPYSGESQNKGKWIMKLMEDYKVEPGGKEKLKEKNPKWLNDDYVKFLRLAQHYVEKNGEGIVAYINPHGFLDNPTFRGMRWKLAETFDEIYVLNLHGNAKKKETVPGGGKDENVFDIMQGVSINLFVKRKDRKDGCILRYADLWGTRKEKNKFLENTKLSAVDWKTIELRAPYYFFVPRDLSIENDYNKGFSLAELMPFTSMGITSANDELNFSFTQAEQQHKIDDLLSMPEKEWREKYKRPRDARDWSYFLAKKDASSASGEMRFATYRPFDDRATVYTGTAKGLYTNPRLDVMKNFLEGDNLGLCCIRIQSRDEVFPVFVTGKITDKTLLSSKDNANVFPLYRYDECVGKVEREANLNVEISERIAPGASPESIFYYVYAVLHSPAYRERYREFLKVDFPRIPYPASDTEFRRLAALGERLVAVHLLKAPEVKDFFSPVAAFPVTGSNRVDAVSYAGGRVLINETQYFDNVPCSAWEYFIGGYQPAQKWLKDRKGRTLSFDDLAHYKSIVLALEETRRLVAQIDADA